MIKPTHTLNPNTGREIQINKVRFHNLLQHRFKYDEKLNRLYDKPMPPDTPRYTPKSRMISPNNRSMIIGGTAFSELLWDNYRRVRGQWVKMSKESAEAYDNDPNIRMMFADADSDSDSENIDIDEFEDDQD